MNRNLTPEQIAELHNETSIVGLSDGEISLAVNRAVDQMARNKRAERIVNDALDIEELGIDPEYVAEQKAYARKVNRGEVQS